MLFWVFHLELFLLIFHFLILYEKLGGGGQNRFFWHLY